MLWEAGKGIISCEELLINYVALFFLTWSDGKVVSVQMYSNVINF